MAWVKLDDDFFSNPKVIKAGRDARDLYLAALCFCNRGLTDGFIPEEALRRLAADADIDDPRTHAERLVEVGLWLHAEGGYQVHAYLEFQPSAESVKQKREEAAERMRKVRSQEVRANKEGSSQKVRSTPSRPVPQPVQRETPSGDTPPKPPAADKPPIALVVDNAPKPWDAWEAFGEAAEYDIGAATEKERSKALGVAKRMLEGGVSVAEIAGCTRYLASQTWRTGILSMSLVEGEMGKWRMAKRPEREPPRRGGTGEMTSVGLMRAASDAMRQGR